MALTIGYSMAVPAAPRKCNRKHILDSRIDEPAYYVIDPEQVPYPYGDSPILPNYEQNYPSEMAAAQIRKYLLIN